MKGNEKLVKALDGLLADELTAINQYMVHSEMCDNWGYGKLHERTEKRAFQEMHHAETLIGRILFLEGTPTVNKLNPIRIGADVPKQLQSDLESEMGAVRLYNEAIRLAVESAITPRATCWCKSSRTRTATSTRSKSRATRSSRWACRSSFRCRHESPLSLRERARVRAACWRTWRSCNLALAALTPGPSPKGRGETGWTPAPRKRASGVWAGNFCDRFPCHGPRRCGEQLFS